MPKAMFGWLWSDGKLYDAPEPKPQHATAQLQPKPRQPWTRRGAFTTRPMSPHHTRIRCEETRDWLYFLLRAGPKPAKEVYRLAKLEGLSAMGVRRAKRHYAIKSIRAGGKGTGRRNPWFWHFPEAAVSK